MNERRLHMAVGLAYGLGVLILLEQFSEVAIGAAATAATSTSSAVWRYGVVGSALGRTTVLVLADVFIVMAAIVRGDDRFLKVWGWAHAVGAVILAFAVVTFALDFLTVRQLANPSLKRGVTLTGLRALTVGLALSGAMFVAGLRLIGIARSRRAASQSSVLVGPVSTHG